MGLDLLTFQRTPTLVSYVTFQEPLGDILKNLNWLISRPLVNSLETAEVAEKGNR